MGNKAHDSLIKTINHGNDKKTSTDILKLLLDHANGKFD
jgi:hypothetical protein